MWNERVTRLAEAEGDPWESAYLKGYAQALEDVAQHLTTGDVLPDGVLSSYQS